jgi:imidazolonepropionase-like amidohydrolase
VIRQVALRADRVYTADAATALSPGFVTLRGATIEAVGSEASPDTVIVDYPGATILPGMIDAHAHITLIGDGKTYQEQMLDPDEMMTLIGVSNMRKHLESGVTTLRDNGGRNRAVFVIREAIERAYVSGPRLLLAGRPITHTGGHFHFCNGTADSESEIRAAVRLLVAEGADHIKLMASGGATMGNIPYYASYTADELRWAVDTAHALGRPTTAHCRATQSMLNAIDAGSDCIEHAEFLVPAPMTEFGGGVASSGRMVYDAAITDRMLDAGTFVSFTAQAGGYETAVALHQRAAEGEALSRAEINRLDTLDAYFEMKTEILARMLEDGMRPKLVISSDAGPFDVSFGTLQHGLELAVRAGMRPIDAIDAVTRIAAEATGQADQIGVLRPGYRADLVVVDGDPLADISAMWHVRQVYSDGRPVLSRVTEEPFGQVGGSAR